jgi:hypothetical protein
MVCVLIFGSQRQIFYNSGDHWKFYRLVTGTGMVTNCFIIHFYSAQFCRVIYDYASEIVYNCQSCKLVISLSCACDDMRKTSYLDPDAQPQAEQSEA